MSNRITTADVRKVAADNGYEYAAFQAFLNVEAGGRGFAPNGKILIQFEPHLFSRELNAVGIKNTLIPLGGQRFRVEVQTSSPTIIDGQHGVDITAWQILNGVQGQTAEWQAFNVAFKINPDAAMKSTSIGMPQILGSHYKRLGFASVGKMWDYFKLGEREQVEMLAKFINTDARLKAALMAKDWHRVASIYNGSGYQALAARLGTVPYNVQMQREYNRLSRL